MIRKLIRETLELLFGALLGSIWIFTFIYALITPDPFEKKKEEYAKKVQCEAYKEHVATDEHIREVYLKECLEGNKNRR